MKKIFTLFLLVVLGAAPVYAETTKQVNFDLNKSSIVWEGFKLTGTHQGNLKLKQAKGQINPDNSLSGDFVVDMSSLTVTDIEDPKYNKKLKDHLLNPDFFDASVFPAVKFVLTKAEPIAGAKESEPNYTISGELVIKNISKPVSFPAYVEIKDKSVVAKGKAVVNRINYDIKYNSGSFFENLGDKLIKDEFNVEVNLVGNLI